MNTDIVKHSSTTADKLLLATELANAGLLPKAYQKQPANLLYAIEYAEALGISPISAITSIHVIDGKPSASAQLIAGLVRQKGHKVRVTYDTATQTATATVNRKDDPDFTFTSVWDMKRAQAAGLAYKDNWKKYQAGMLKARALTEVCRDAAPEALFGIVYTAEEMGAANTDEDGAMIEATLSPVQPDFDPLISDANKERFKDACTNIGLDWVEVCVAAGISSEGWDGLRESGRLRLLDAFRLAKEEALKEPIVDAEIVEVAPAEKAPPITPAQTKVLVALTRGKGWDDEETYRQTSEYVGRIVESFKELSTVEADKFIKQVKGLGDGA